MNKGEQLRGKPVSSSAQLKATVAQQRPGLQNRASGHPDSGGNQTPRSPVAPPPYRVEKVARALQAKMHTAGRPTQSRSVATSAGGVVQANVIGGSHALQARLNGWHTRVTRGRNKNVEDSSPRGSGQTVQRKSGPGVEAFRVPLRPKSGGLPIPAEVRSKMEAAFDTDFGDVRVHIGQEASSLGAIAYTWGTNIHFAPGQYNPHTIQGQKLLGHELWHVVQQKNGRVRNPFGGGVAVVQDHALEAEADRMGIKAAMSQVARKARE